MTALDWWQLKIIFRIPMMQHDRYIRSSASNASLRETIAVCVTRLVLKKLHWPLFDAPLQTLDEAFRSCNTRGFHTNSFEPLNEYPSLVVSFSALCFCKQSTSTLCWQQDKTCHLPGCEWWQPYCIGLNMEGHWVKEEHERSKYMNKSITSCMFCVILCNYN